MYLRVCYVLQHFAVSRCEAGSGLLPMVCHQTQSCNETMWWSSHSAWFIHELLSEFCLQNIYPSFSHWTWVSSRAPAIPMLLKGPRPVWASPSHAAHELCDFTSLEATMNPKVGFLRTNHFPKLLRKEQNRIGEVRREQKHGPTAKTGQRQRCQHLDRTFHPRAGWCTRAADRW